MKSIVFAEYLTLPDSVRNHASFRRWITAEDIPEKARVSYLDGDIWVDMPHDRLVHGRCSVAISSALSNLIANREFGVAFVAGMLLSNREAGLSTQPDFMFIANETLNSSTVIFPTGDDSPEVLGSPDMTVEVISATSVKKDTVDLVRLYFDAGVKEYWLVDSREKSFSFDILRRASSKFIVTRKSHGWVKSQVFDREFKLTRATSKHGVSKFTLEMR